MNGAEFPLFIVAHGDSFEGFNADDIQGADGPIGVFPAIGTEQQARSAIAELSRISGKPSAFFRICRYELKEVLEG